jgi:TRAP-type mannitol/chloroaromatic compound transport system substrate-binding protein
MGMVVRQLPGGEIQPAMKTGLIDAAEFNTILYHYWYLEVKQVITLSGQDMWIQYQT